LDEGKYHQGEASVVRFFGRKWMEQAIGNLLHIVIP
jgi:hypothetical protein